MVGAHKDRTSDDRRQISGDSKDSGVKDDSEVKDSGNSLKEMKDCADSLTLSLPGSDNPPETPAAAEEDAPPVLTLSLPGSDNPPETPEADTPPALTLSPPGSDNPLQTPAAADTPHPPPAAAAAVTDPIPLTIAVTDPTPLTIMQTPLTFTSHLSAPYTGFGHIANVNVNGNTNENENENTRVPARSPRGRARLAQGRSETVPPPFPWATDRRAMVHSREYLLQNNIITISGKVQCKKCDERFEMNLDLEEKLGELLTFIGRNRGSMHDRAPKVWAEPVLPTCEHCGRENSVAPFLADTKKKAINWLFLFLAQMLGCCTIKQLKYFCKHTNSHRTGAKDRLVYSAYMILCQQLLPQYYNS